MQVLHESNLTTELIKGPITYEICKRARTPLPLFTVILLKPVSSAPSSNILRHPKKLSKRLLVKHWIVFRML